MRAMQRPYNGYAPLTPTLPHEPSPIQLNLGTGPLIVSLVFLYLNREILGRGVGHTAPARVGFSGRIDKNLVFLSPTGYSMLVSCGFSLLN